jgi:hypothetical protein
LVRQDLPGLLSAAIATVFGFFVAVAFTVVEHRVYAPAFVSLQKLRTKAADTFAAAASTLRFAFSCG